MIARVGSELGLETFLAEYLRPQRPVLIEGGVAQWKAMQWTPESLAELVGDERVKIAHKRGDSVFAFDPAGHVTFEKVVRIPAGTAPEDVTAHYGDGVLIVSWPVASPR